MANPEHLKILKQGVEVWNRWREENSEIEPDISKAEISGIYLEGANLSKVDLHGSWLVRANLSHTDLSGANLSKAELMRANFYEANLSGYALRITNFLFANLSETTLSRANMLGTHFHQSEFKNTNFSESYLENTVFSQTDISTCKGFDSVHVGGSCSIDFHTLRVSRNLPKSFLLKIGLPKNYINYLPDFFDENPIRMYPVFLSHSWQNKDFANKLYEALIARGVQAWYDEKKIKPGDDIYESLSRGIEVYDKMILVCSQQSLMESWWVDREIDRILAKERQLQKERGKRINLLIPIRIDDHIFEWDGAKGEEVRRYIIGDFRHWQDEAKFQKALDELIAALNVDRGDDAPPTFL